METKKNEFRTGPGSAREYDGRWVAVEQDKLKVTEMVKRCISG